MTLARRQQFKYLCLLLACFCVCPLYSQDKQIAEYWVRQLSVRRDFLGANEYSIYYSLLLVDSTRRCSLLTDLEKLGPKKNKRFQIRLHCLHGLMAANYYPCIEPQYIRERMSHALQLAYEIEDPWLIEEVHETLMRVHFSFQEKGLAIVHALTAIEMQKTLGIENFNRIATLRYEIGYLLYYAKEYRTAIQLTHDAIQKGPTLGAPGDTLSTFYKMNAWNTIGLGHMKLHEYDSAFMAYQYAYDLAGQLNESWLSDFWKGIIKGNRGDIYYQTGNMDSARVLLQFDYQHSLYNNQYDNAANSLQWLARIHATEGKLPLALKEIREADLLVQRLPKTEYKANIYYTYAEIFKALKNSDSLDHYLKKYMVLQDSLDQAAFESKSDIVRVRMENQKSIHQIKELNKEKKNILMIRNFIVVIVLLFATIGYLFFHRERLKQRIRQQEALQDKMKAEADAILARDQLKVFTQHILEKTDLVDALKAQLFQKEYSHEQATNESELSQLQILTDEDWDKFKNLFENVYPGFFQALKRKTEGITIAEQRMSSLIKLKVPAKKAAIILGISPNSVYKTRQRLRHRLGLSTDGELDDYFS